MDGTGVCVGVGATVGITVGAGVGDVGWRVAVTDGKAVGEGVKPLPSSPPQAAKISTATSAAGRNRFIDPLPPFAGRLPPAR